MTRRITTLNDLPVDPIEAVKRGFIHRGFLPRKYHRNSQLSEQADSKPANDSSQSDSSSMPKDDTGDQMQSDFVNSEDKTEQEDDKKTPKPEPATIHEKLIDMAEKAHDVLYQSETVFPFTLFPDTITIDREKLSVAKRSFFRVAKIITVPITSLISAEADVGPFFGTVRMTSKYFVDNTHEVNFLTRNDATHIHRLLQGFIIAHEKGLDVTEVETDDLRVLLEDLGQGVND
jgi:hypothetical protein